MITIKGVFGREMYETWYMMTVMLQGGLDVSPVITHRFPYTDYEAAFDAVRSGAGGQGGALLAGGTHDRRRARASSTRELEEIREAGTFKTERVLIERAGTTRRRSPGARASGFVNLCANDYLGLANHPEIVAAAREALDRWGFGVASVRFICGTQQVHKRSRGRADGLPRDGGHDPVSVVLRRERRAVRDAARPTRTR